MRYFSTFIRRDMFVQIIGYVRLSQGWLGHSQLFDLKEFSASGEEQS